MNASPKPQSDRKPQQQIDQDTVLYDGHCAFCTRSVRQLEKFDGKGRLKFVSIHDPLVQEKYPDLKLEQLMQQMYVIPDRTQARFGGAAALRYLSRRLPRLWIFAPLLHLPFSLPFWQFCYRQIAKRRYRLASDTVSCENGNCDLHYPKSKSE